MIIRSIHKRVARYLLIGMSPVQIEKTLKGSCKAAQIRLWRHDVTFKKYMLNLEKKYLELIDNDLNHLRRSAVHRLQEIIDVPYGDKNFDITHFEWAMNKVFQVTLLRDKTLNVNQLVEQREGKAAETPEQKQALKELVRVMGDPQRYGHSNRVGEA